MACWEDEMFKNPAAADDFCCPICYGVLKDPVRDPHDHVFGLTCIENSLVNNSNCPMTRTNIRGELVPAEDLRERMAGEEVYCCVRNDGCTWEGVLGDIDHHLQNQCEFFPLPCRFNGCPQFITRSEMPDHEASCPFRPEPCGHCGQSLLAKQLESHIEKNCPEFGIGCSSNCGKTFPRKMLAFHLKYACTLRQVNCRFSHLGCQFKGRPEEISSHMQLAAFLHLSLAEEQLAQHKAMVLVMNQQTSHLKTLANKVPTTEGSTVKDDLLGAIESLRTLPSKKFPTNLVEFYVPNDTPSGAITIRQKEAVAKGAAGDLLILDRDFDRNSQLAFTIFQERDEGATGMTAVGFVPKTAALLQHNRQLLKPADSIFQSILIGKERVEGIPFLPAESGDPVMLEYSAEEQKIFVTNLGSGEEVEVKADIDITIWQPYLALWGNQRVRLESLAERSESFP